MTHVSRLIPSGPNIFRIATAVVALLVVASAGAETVVSVTPALGSLQNALNTVPEGGVIELAAGTYAAPLGGFTVFARIPDGAVAGFTMRAAKNAAVVLTGSDRAEIFVITTPRLITFEGLTFRNGRATTNGRAGAMSMNGAYASFFSCTFDANVGEAPAFGSGALWIYNSSVSFQGCTWTNNTSKHFGAGMSAAESRVFIRDSRFVHNRSNVPGHSSFSTGGAIHGHNSTIRIDNTRFEDNQAGYVGGAIYALGEWREPYSQPTAELVVNNCLFLRNATVKDPSGTLSSPTNGGAVMTENQIRGQFSNSRFISNSSNQGGAISGYRSSSDIDNCTFHANVAAGSGPSDGFGGSIFVLSADKPEQTTGFGTINRPSARLSVTDSLFQGAGGGAISGRQGGGIFIAGDLNSAFGIGVTKNGTADSNRAVVSLKRVLFADLATQHTSLGTGGAMTGDFIDLTVDETIVQNCTTSHHGGGFQLITYSVGKITNTTFAQNSAGGLGGAFNIFGGLLNMSGCKFLNNGVSGTGGGAAMFGGPVAGNPTKGLPDSELNGAISNCVFSNNTGGAAIYDGNAYSAGPYNRLQYNKNQFFSGALPTFYNGSVGNLSVQALNALILQRADRTSSIKAAVPNVSLASTPVTGAVLMLPATVLQSGAPDEPLPIPSSVTYATSGGSVVLNGVPRPGATGMITTVKDGTQRLDVANTSYGTDAPAGAAVNISTRLPAGSGDKALIAGFIVQGTAPKRVLIRAIGPSLSSSGIQRALQDPTLELFDSRSVSLGRNSDWQLSQIGGLISRDQSLEIGASGIAPSNAREPAMIVTLDPNKPYTAVVGSANGSSGIAIVEVYDLEGVQAAQLANISTRG
ncbi:MAG: hypothetical protein H0T11_09360, partial [Chthoniobacterales bacterium]|nr:hypothetical protein [Chthoniobacterales bacterium]